MPRLSNVMLKAVALTGTPANRRHIHAKKSATKEQPMTPGHAEKETPEALPAPSAEVLKALGEVKLTKAAGDAEHEAAAEAVGHLLAAHPGLTMEDLAAVAKAAGVAPVAKAETEDEDEDEELEDETDEDSASDKPGNPWAKKMKKSAAEPEQLEVLKSAPAPIAKAIAALRKSHEDERAADRVRLAKAERMLVEERDYRLTNLIKSEVAGTFRHLAVDHDKLTSVIKHARDGGQAKHAEHIMQVLKSAEAQLALANKSQGGSAFGSVGKSSQFGAGSGGDAWSQIEAHVDAMVQKGEVKKSRPQLVDEFLMTAEGQALANQHREERGF